jgi:cytochrome c oxidase subunit 3
MVVVVAWLFKQTLNVRPWIQPREADAGFISGRSYAPPVKIGLIAFLAVATSLFSLFISAFLMRSQETDWRSLAIPGFLWVNTALIIAASAAMEITRILAHRDNAPGVKAGLAASCALTLAFIAGQYTVWLQLAEAGKFAAANPGNAFFYLLTGIHGLHLLGGLFVLGRTTVKAWRGSEVDAITESVDLCALYWHFLLLVWLVLLAVLWSAAKGIIGYCA